MREIIAELEMERVDVLPGFACQLCARCCKGKLIALYTRDLERMQGLEAFIEETSNEEEGVTGAKHKMKMVRGVCALLRDGRCTQYGVRPDTCRRHPFIVTPNSILVSTTCGGVDRSARGVPDRWAELSEGIAQPIDRYLSGMGRRKSRRE